MRDVAGWPTNTDATEPIYRVSQGGRDREVNRLSLSRTLPSSNHEQVAGVGGIVQATGQVTWASRSDVTPGHSTAFHRADSWPPKPRDGVSVYTGYRTASGDALAKQLTGFISDSNGDPQSETTSGLVDNYARLSRKVTLPPLLNNMPPLTDRGPWRGVGLYPTYFTDLAARAGSYCSTPPMSNGCLFSAPLMGGAWPERGTLVTGLRYTDRNNANATWRESRWGMGVANALLSYTPWNGTQLDRPMEITAMFQVGGGEARVGVAWGGASISIFRSSVSIHAQLINASGLTTVCSLGSVSDILTLRVVPNGGTLTLTLRDAAGKEASGTVAKPAESAGNASEVLVHSTTDAMIVGGVQVAFPATAWTALNYTRSAFITPAAHNDTLPASPPIQGVPARELLNDQARAEMAGLWIDGDGFLHWVNRLRLVSAAPSATLTAKDNLKSLQWEEDFTGVASVVEVVGRKAEAILQSKVPRHEVWQSNYGDVDADGSEVFEELLHPDADEDWIMVDRSFNNDFNATNRLEGSDVVLYHFFSSGTKGQAGYTTQEGYERAWVGATLQQIDHRTYKLTTRVYGVSAGGYEKAEFSLKIPSERQGPAPGGWPAGFGAMGFPVIRAYAKIMWADAVYTANAGAWDAEVLTHDVGWWVQDAGACQAIADSLASQTMTPRPVLRGVSIVPDARLERGDVVTLYDPDLTGVEFRCLVVGIDDEFTSNPISWSQSCDFRVLDYKSITLTLSELDTAWAGSLLSALDAARDGESLAQFDADPLKGAPL